MLDHLDTFLAFGAVMFGVSLFITAITQFVSGLFSMRGSELALGLERLVGYVAPELERQARAVSEAITRHPLISDSAVGGNGRATRRASAVREDEVKRLLRGSHFWADAARHFVEQELEGQSTALDALKKVNPEGWRDAWSKAVAEGPEALEHFLSRALGDVDSAERMKRIGAQLAPLAEAERNAEVFVDRLGDWFKTAMDRTSQRFASKMRLITVAASALLALAMRFDTFALLDQLSKDPELRSRVALQIEHLNQQYGELKQTAPGKTLEARVATMNAATADLKGLGIQLVPPTWGLPTLSELPGILASMALLSLGAPFWFNLLRQMGNLRPVVANLEHGERRDAKRKEVGG